MILKQLDYEKKDFQVFQVKFNYGLTEILCINYFYIKTDVVLLTCFNNLMNERFGQVLAK